MAFFATFSILDATVSIFSLAKKKAQAHVNVV
jgi:hypothetical protein